MLISMMMSLMMATTNMMMIATPHMKTRMLMINNEFEYIGPLLLKNLN